MDDVSKGKTGPQCVHASLPPPVLSIFQYAWTYTDNVQGHVYLIWNYGDVLHGKII